ncbi:hypothetical protein EC844_12936 [Acinetobacter calcoaceticus]|uniref:Sel1 repeat family protein n=1 Tax=Acinetobacter calcoaceticus TaxID=471 RepID=A0A4R1XNJ9_ACICA|nr:hypothetical protein EC844_12936 [Acinetobacter calcoaceticus]
MSIKITRRFKDKKGYLLTGFMLLLANSAVADSNQQLDYCETHFCELIVDEQAQRLEQAQAFDLGLDVEQDKAKALQMYQQLAEQGNVEAQWELGYKYVADPDTKQDFDRAVLYLGKAAEQNHVKAQHLLGSIYFNPGFSGYDPQKGIHWLTRAAEQDFRVAQEELGRVYELGVGTAVDYAKARHWYIKATNNGNRLASYYLALMYTNGKGMPADHDKASELLEYLNDRAVPEVSLDIAQNYHYAKNDFPLNLTQAKRWYRLAAKQGSLEAQAILEVWS